MKLIIDIPEEKYKTIQEGMYCGMLDADLYRDIKNGTPLPKGHGRLIDIDLLRDQVSHDEREAFSKHQVWLLLSVHNKKIPTIIEADKEEIYEIVDYITDKVNGDKEDE